MKLRREIEAFGLSFLDVISCGFGAILLLLVLTKVFEPTILEETAEQLEGRLANLQEQLFEIRGDTRVINRELLSKKQQLSVEKSRLARLQADMSKIKGEFAASEDDSSVYDVIEGQLTIALQELTDEMERLLRGFRKAEDDTTIGGVPVDSEYIIFVIDTSGSMFNYSWDLVLDKFRETLDVHPQVKGIQVLNDMGNYMFSRYQDKWIRDTPARRKAMVDRLRTWNSFSNSSPVEGITRAISAFWAPDKRISIYVFGDEFTGRSIQSVLDQVARINRVDKEGNRRVRIHAIGFPVQFSRAANMQLTGIRFATLMRQLCQENGGTFVGLPDYR